MTLGEPELMYAGCHYVTGPSGQSPTPFEWGVRWAITNTGMRPLSVCLGKY
jgi:hypothetical protein